MTKIDTTPIRWTDIYLILSQFGVVNSIDSFLNMPISTIELLLERINEHLRERMISDGRNW